MKVHFECVPCLLRQASDATKLGSVDASSREDALRAVMDYLSKERWDKTAPELATNVHRIIKRATGNSDPYKELKEKYNRAALSFHEKLTSVVAASDDPLLTASKPAITGNVIDFGPRTDVDLEKEIENGLNSSLVINDIDKLKELLVSGSRNRKVLYLADNAGETVFDRILVEELLKNRAEVTYAVKDAPILNDATFHDAETAGITEITNVISIGADCTGVLFEECSPAFLDEFESSDCVISKGQGNYESLSDIKHKEIFFLLKVKCPIIAEDIGAETGSAILKRNCV